MDMKTSEELLSMFNGYLHALPYNRQPESLYEPIKYVLSIGGKRIRPVLMLLAYNLYKDDVESILAPAAAIETYHNYTLLHDDLMDNAPMRRGKQTVHTKWNPNTAILSGDSMLVLAYQRMAQCEPRLLAEVMQLFTETALQIGEGQQYDMEFENRNDVTEDEYIEMIRLKTSILLACSLKIGAILAGAPASDAEALYKFGETIGLAFQLQDDCLDVYGDPAVFGKATGGDILCNKKTYMLINAFLMANDEQRSQLEHWTSITDTDNPQQKIKEVTRLYDNIGVRRLAEDKISELYDSARKYLALVGVAPERKKELDAYASWMMKRSL